MTVALKLIRKARSQDQKDQDLGKTALDLDQTPLGRAIALALGTKPHTLVQGLSMGQGLVIEFGDELELPGALGESEQGHVFTAGRIIFCQYSKQLIITYGKVVHMNADGVPTPCIPIGSFAAEQYYLDSFGEQVRYGGAMEVTRI
jgi:hypothetical protein